MSQILVFGDSVAYGRWDTAKGGWVSQLIDFYMKKDLVDPNFYHEVYNLSIDGDDSKRLVSRFEFETRQRLGQDEVIVIFAIGKNDSCFIKNKDTFLTPPKTFEKNVKKLISLAKKYSSKIIFISTIMIDEKKTMPVSWDKNLYYNNEYLKRYNDIMKSVCWENKINFVDVFEKFEKLDYKKILEDGLHPNSEGHRIIYKTVQKFLIDKKIV